MSNPTIAFLRDIAAILICLECAVLVAVPGVILFFAQKYLRKGRRALHVPFLRVQVLALRVQNVTMNVSDAIAKVPIKIQMVGTRVRATAQNLLPR